MPWERVFCHDNVEMTRAIYMRTPGHAMANHQANVRFLEKLKLIVGIASKIADMNGARNVPAVQFTLGRLAAMQATLEGLIMGQINCRRGAARTAITPSTAATSMRRCTGAPTTTRRSATPCAN